MHPLISQFETYWNEIRGDNPAPYKADFDITDLPPRTWRFITLVAVEHKPRRYKYVLFGGASRDAYGMDISGMYLEEVDLGDKREKIERNFHEAAESRKPIYISDSYKKEDAVVYGFDGGTYPFTDESGQVSHLVLVSAPTRNGTPVEY